MSTANTSAMAIQLANLITNTARVNWPASPNRLPINPPMPKFEVSQPMYFEVEGIAKDTLPILGWIAEHCSAYEFRVIETVSSHGDMFPFSVVFHDDAEAVHFKLRWFGEQDGQ